MSCARCKSASINDGKGIETFPAFGSNSLSDENLDPQVVCDKCAIGHMIPVFRLSRKQWEFGVVEDYKDAPQEGTGGQDESKKGLHGLRFMDGEYERVALERNAYAQYIQYYNQPSRLPEIDTSSFSEPSDAADKATTKDTPSSADAKSSLPPTKPNCTSTTSTMNVPHPTPLASLPGVASPSSRNNPSSSRSAAVASKGMQKSARKETKTKSVQKLKKKQSIPKFRQRPWTPKEDEVLVKAVGNKSESSLKWSVLAKLVPSRNGKQCRERYVNHLAPDINPEKWSLAEDAMLFEAVEQVGSKWSKICKVMRGRTDNGCKNRYNKLKRKAERQHLVTQSKRTGSMKDLSAKIRKRLLASKDVDDWILTSVVSEISEPKEMPVSKNDLRLGRDEPCTRCGFFVPSSQTGRFIFKKFGWCEACLQASSFIPREVLRVSRTIEGEPRADLRGSHTVQKKLEGATD